MATTDEDTTYRLNAHDALKLIQEGKHPVGILKNATFDGEPVEVLAVYLDGGVIPLFIHAGESLYKRLGVTPL